MRARIGRYSTLSSASLLTFRNIPKVDPANRADEGLDREKTHGGSLSANGRCVAARARTPPQTLLDPCRGVQSWHSALVGPGTPRERAAPRRAGRRAAASSQHRLPRVAIPPRPRSNLSRNGARPDGALSLGEAEAASGCSPQTGVAARRLAPGCFHNTVLKKSEDAHDQLRPSVYCGPVLRHPAGLVQAANFRSAVAF